MISLRTSNSRAPSARRRLVIFAYVVRWKSLTVHVSIPFGPLATPHRLLASLYE
jgi:hypothetical protein